MRTDVGKTSDKTGQSLKMMISNDQFDIFGTELSYSELVE